MTCSTRSLDGLSDLRRGLEHLVRSICNVLCLTLRALSRVLSMRSGSTIDAMTDLPQLFDDATIRKSFWADF